MANYTPKLNLKLPEQQDYYNVNDFNENFGKIDNAVLTLTHIPASQNFDIDTLTVAGEYKFSNLGRYESLGERSGSYPGDVKTGMVVKVLSFATQMYSGFQMVLQKAYVPNNNSDSEYVEYSRISRFAPDGTPERWSSWKSEKPMPLNDCNASNTWAVRWNVFADPSNKRRELNIETGIAVGGTHTTNARDARDAFTPNAGEKYVIEITAYGSGEMRLRTNYKDGLDNNYYDPNENNPNVNTRNISLSNNPEILSLPWTQKSNGGDLVISANNNAITYITRIVIYNANTMQQVWQLDFSKLDINGAVRTNNGVRALGSAVPGSEYLPGVRRQSDSNNDNSIQMLRTTDLNQVMQTGFYVLKGNEFQTLNGPNEVIIQGDDNLSGDNVAVLQVMRISDTNVMQTLHHNSQGVWTRSLQESNWSNWERLITQTAANGATTPHTHNASDINAGTLQTARIADNAVTAAKIATNSVTNAKIANSAVTAEKMDNSGVEAGVYGNTETSLEFGGSFNVPQITFDVKGRAISANNRAITFPSLPKTATKAEAAAGTSTSTRIWTPERVRQAAQAAPRYRGTEARTHLYTGTIISGAVTIIMDDSLQWDSFDFIEIDTTFNAAFDSSVLIPKQTSIIPVSTLCATTDESPWSLLTIPLGGNPNNILSCLRGIIYRVSDNNTQLNVCLLATETITMPKFGLDLIIHGIRAV